MSDCIDQRDPRARAAEIIWRIMQLMPTNGLINRDTIRINRDQDGSITIQFTGMVTVSEDIAFDFIKTRLELGHEIRLTDRNWDAREHGGQR